MAGERKAPGMALTNCMVRLYSTASMWVTSQSMVAKAENWVSMVSGGWSGRSMRSARLVLTPVSAQRHHKAECEVGAWSSWRMALQTCVGGVRLRWWCQTALVGMSCKRTCTMRAWPVAAKCWMLSSMARWMLSMKWSARTPAMACSLCEAACFCM